MMESGLRVSGTGCFTTELPGAAVGVASTALSIGLVVSSSGDAVTVSTFADPPREQALDSSATTKNARAILTISSSAVPSSASGATCAAGTRGHAPKHCPVA
jgi:hypothetical protein